MFKSNSSCLTGTYLCVQPCIRTFQTTLNDWSWIMKNKINETTHSNAPVRNLCTFPHQTNAYVHIMKGKFLMMGVNIWMGLPRDS